jgi:hypothetical protein
MSVKLVRDEADEFFSQMMPTAEKFVSDARAFVSAVPQADPARPRMDNLLYELDLKVREAMHRVSDLCAAYVQTAKAASEKVG